MHNTHFRHEPPEKCSLCVLYFAGELAGAAGAVGSAFTGVTGAALIGMACGCVFSLRVSVARASGSIAVPFLAPAVPGSESLGISDAETILPGIGNLSVSK